MRKFFQFALPAFISVALFGFTIFLYILPTMEEAIMAKKKEATREVVRIVMNLLKTYHTNVVRGEIDLAEAQQRALNRIRSLRYGANSKEYYWVTDLSPRMLMHPYRPDLDNQDLGNFQDPSGKKLFVEMVAQVEKNEAGFVEYLWQHHDNADMVVPKISYVSLFKPWGWIVGSGLYYDDVQLEISRITRELTLFGLGVFALVAILSSYLAWRGVIVMRENQQVMASLQRSEAKFRGISFSANDGIIMIDTSGLVTFWNKAAETIFGYQEEEVMGKDLHKLLAHGEQYHGYLAASRRFQQDGSGFAVGKTLELSARHKDGHAFPVELSISALNFDDKWHAVGVVRDISEKKKAAQDLLESETKYRTVFDSANDIILLIKDGIIFDCNARAMEFFLFDKEEIIGKTPVDLSPERQQSGELSAVIAQQIIDRALHDEAQNFEWMHQTSAGELRFVDVTLEKMTLFGEEVLLAICRDMTERTKMLLEKEKAASLFMASIEQLQAGIIIADATDGKLLHVNRVALKMMGETEDLLHRDREEIAKVSWRILNRDGNVVEPSDQPLQRAYKQGLVTTNSTYIIEKGDGTRTWIEVNASPVRDSTGKVIYGVVVFTDISGRIRTEEELRHLNQFQESIIENANVWMTVHDLDGNVILWNQAAETISGYKREDVIGSNAVWRQAYPDAENRNRIMQLVAEVVRTGQVAKNKETTIRCQDGTSKTMSWYVCRLGGPGESRPEVLYLGYDVSERRRLQQQLLQTQKLEAVGTLAAGIAHDFNNVLWGILGYSELAMVQINKDAKQAQRSIRRVLEAGNRAKYMVQQILQFSRQSEINMGPLDLKSVVKEVVKLLQATVPSNFEIQLKIANHIGWVHADATQIHQVVMNLSTNAYHAMQPHQKGVMRLSLEAVELAEIAHCHGQQLFPGRYIRMRISDTGEGIDPENYAKIFDPYFTTKGQGEGTGLGLAVSFGIIKAHGGGIQVESEKGKGTVFTIYLPEKEDDIVMPVSEIEPVIGGSEHVFLVDDEAILVEMTEEMLQRLGYRVTSFSDSEEAWKYFAGNSDRFDIVITDMAMPRMTGLELAARITAHAPGIPIVICTGFSEKIYRQDMERSGIATVLNKPLMQKELAAAIRRVLPHTDAG